MSTCHFDGPDADCYARKDVTTIIYCVVCAAVGMEKFYEHQLLLGVFNNFF